MIYARGIDISQFPDGTPPMSMYNPNCNWE